MRIIKFLAPLNLASKTLEEIERKNFDVKLIALKTDNNWITSIDYGHKIKEDDLLAYIGDAKSIVPKICQERKIKTG